MTTAVRWWTIRARLRSAGKQELLERLPNADPLGRGFAREQNVAMRELLTSQEAAADDDEDEDDASKEAVSGGDGGCGVGNGDGNDDVDRRRRQR